MMVHTRHDVQPTVRQHSVRCTCMLDGDDPVLVTTDDQCGQNPVKAQAIQGAYRLTAEVDNRAESAQECLPVVPGSTATDAL